jgi:hypothetical protein
MLKYADNKLIGPVSKLGKIFEMTIRIAMMLKYVLDSGTTRIILRTICYEIRGC